MRLATTYEAPKGPESITVQAWNDPWFALGNLLARAWNKQYNDRGVNKLIDSVSGSIPGQEKTELPTMNGQDVIYSKYLEENPTPKIGTDQIPEPMYTVGDNVPGMVEAGNIDLNNRPVVKNPDGSISTVRSVGVNLDGKEYLLPSVSDDGKILSTDEAVNQFRNTGKHLGVFNTPEDATNYAKSLHNQQDMAYNNATNNLNDYTRAVENAADENLNYNQLNQLVSGNTPKTNGNTSNSALDNAVTNYINNNVPKATDPNRIEIPQQTPQPFNFNDWAASIQREGIAQGRPQEQIDEAIARLTPQAKAAEQNYNDYATKQVLQYLPTALQIGKETGDYTPAYGLYNSLSKYNPQLAKTLFGGTPTPADVQSNIWDAEKQQRGFSNTKALKTMDYNHEDAVNARNRQDALSMMKFAAANGFYYNPKTGSLTRLSPAGGSSGSGTSGGTGGTSKGGSAPTAQDKMIYNMINSAGNAFASGDKSSIQKVTTFLQDFKDKLDNDPEERYKYDDRTYNLITQGIYTGNALAAYLNGDTDSAKQYSSAVSTAESPWTRYLPEYRNQ